MNDSHFNSVRNLLFFHGAILPEKDLLQLLSEKKILLNGQPASIDTIIKPDDEVSVDSIPFQVLRGGRDRLQLLGPQEPSPTCLSHPLRLHCGLHKCLTMYQRRVYNTSLRASRRLRLDFSARGRKPFRHFFHRKDAFQLYQSRFIASSLSGHYIDLNSYDDAKVVRFVRDPRDLLVSGYFYHKREAEFWSSLPDSNDADWETVNGCVSERIPPGKSLGGYLQDASVEDGMRAEIDFRRHHFENLLKWPEDDPRVRVYRYEDILGNEVEIFSEIFEFMQFPLSARIASKYYANRYRLGKNRSNKKHIRNPKSGQWRKHFTPALESEFNELYGKLLERHGYE